MPSTAYRRWRTVRTAALDEIAHAHVAVGGAGPGRRHATLQLNRAYTVLLAAEFQGFCRDLHTDCVDHYLGVLTPPVAMGNTLRAEFMRGRQLDRGNAQPGSLGADYGRLGIDFWDELTRHDPATTRWKDDLELLNEWRNAITHQDFTSPRLSGTMNLRLAQVKRWRASCRSLAHVMDKVMSRHLHALTGTSPW
jgi:hypothetical protein